MSDAMHRYFDEFAAVSQKALRRDLAEQHERLAQSLKRPQLPQGEDQLMGDALRWYLDEFSNRWVGGWIDDDGPVDLTLVVNDRPVATIRADTYREDLERAGIGDGRRAFTFSLSGYLTQPENTVSFLYGDRVLGTLICEPINEAARLAAVARSQRGATGSSKPSNEIVLVQTSDATAYSQMLQVTSRTVLAYCARHQGIRSELHVGLHRGCTPWHATYNRITILRNMLNNGYRGWVCYLDADAFITDLSFDLKHYLSDKDDIALIITTDNVEDKTRPYFAVNAGTFLINLAHPVGKEIIWKWADKLDAVTDELFAEYHDASHWGNARFEDDQAMLTNILANLSGGERGILTLRDYPNLLNYAHGQFIGQVLRAEAASLEQRLEHLRAATDQVLMHGKVS